MVRFILLAFSFSVFLKPCWGKVLIVALAQVKDHVITSREIDIHEALSPVLDYDFDSFKNISPRDQVIKEWLLFYEALGFYSHPVKNSEQIKKMKQAKKQALQSGIWGKLKMKDDELKEKVKRHLEARRLYSFKKKASKLPISAFEVENEYKTNKTHYQSMSPDEAKAQISKNLGQKKLEKHLNEWFDVLEQKYKVHYFSEK